MKKISLLKAISFPQWVVYASLFALGVFHVYLSCVLSVVLLIWLLVRLYRNGTITISLTWIGAAITLLVIGYAVTTLWAVDSGEAIVGFFNIYRCCCILSY